MELEGFLCWQDSGHFDIFNNIILLFKFIVFLLSCDVFPPHDRKAIDAIDVLYCVVPADEMLLRGLAFKDVDHIGREEGFARLALVVVPDHVQVHVAKDVVANFASAFRLSFKVEVF